MGTAPLRNIRARHVVETAGGQRAALRLVCGHTEVRPFGEVPAARARCEQCGTARRGGVSDDVYMTIVNRARVTAALEVLRGVMASPSTGVTEEEFKAACEPLCRLQERLFLAVREGRRGGRG